MNNRVTTKIIIAIAIAFVVGLVVFFAFLGLWGNVPSNHTGIRVRWSVVQNDPLPEGRYWRVPFSEGLVVMDNRIQSVRVAAGVDGATTEQTAETKDQQELPKFDFTIQYQLLPEKSIEVYKAYGENYAKPLIQETALPIIKNVFAKYMSDDIVSNKENIPKEIFDQLNELSEPYGVVVRRVIMNSYDFTPEYNNLMNEYAVETRKLKNNELALKNRQLEAQAEYDKQVKDAERDAEVRRINSEAEKTATLLKAQTDAEIEMVRAEADRKSRIASAEATKAELEAQAAGLNDLVVQQEFIKKWNGVIPPNFGSGSTGINISDYTDIVKAALGNQE